MHIQKLFSIKDKVAIVTGGYGFYGRCISEGLCEGGAVVIIASRNEAKCEEWASELRGRGYRAFGMQLDLSSDGSIKTLASEVYKKFGCIDILVNNAVDRSNMVSLEQASRQKLQDSCDTNLSGQLLLSQAVIKYMLKQKQGNIINISSMRGLDSPHFPFYPETWGQQPINYTTEKWAMIGMTKYMAGFYGKDNIRVNCIAPGGYNPGLDGDPDKKAFIDTYIENCPLRCWATEDDIKGLSSSGFRRFKVCDRRYACYGRRLDDLVTQGVLKKGWIFKYEICNVKRHGYVRVFTWHCTAWNVLWGKQ
jgi:NAD(P)-dependent dehydrogenase (short-subunit alcohol dehydrogenase family)